MWIVAVAVSSLVDQLRAARSRIVQLFTNLTWGSEEMMRGRCREAIAPLASIMLLVVLAGCGEPQADPGPGTEAIPSGGDPSAALMENPDGTTLLMAAGLGSDLALVRADYEGNEAHRPVLAAFRTPDGTWADLPVPDVFGSFQLAAAGDTVMIGGLECTNDDCTRMSPRFLVLEADRSAWREVPSALPEIEVNRDVEPQEGVAMAYQRPMEHAMFTLGFVNYAVDPETGPVELRYEDLDLINNYGFYCLSDDTEIMVPGSASSTDVPVTLDGVVMTRSLEDAAGEFKIVAEAPRIEVDQLSSICGHRAISVHTGPQEHHFDLDSLQWTTRPTNYMEVNHGTTIAKADRGQLALPDGTVFEDNRTRSPEGVWSLIPSDSRLVSTRSGVVYALGIDGVSTFREAK